MKRRLSGAPGSGGPPSGGAATAGSIFTKIQRLVHAHSVTLVWAGISESVEEELKRAGVITKASHVFPTLDKAEKWVEDRLLAHVHEQHRLGAQQEALRIEAGVDHRRAKKRLHLRVRSEDVRCLERRVAQPVAHKQRLVRAVLQQPHHKRQVAMPGSLV